MSKLLTEWMPLSYNPDLITEAVANGNQTILLRGVTLQRVNAKNQNGRIYPREIMMRECERYLQEFVQQRRALGELDHPESTVVNLKNVSHNVVNMHWEGDDLIGDVELLSTPSGNIVKELMKNKIKLGVSSRGVGSVKQLGESTVQVEEDFNLICFDIVSNPSTHGAFLNENINKALQLSRVDRINGLVIDFLSEIGG